MRSVETNRLASSQVAFSRHQHSFEFAVLSVAPIHSSKTGSSGLFLLTRNPVGSQACVIRALAETSILQDAIEFGC